MSRPCAALDVKMHGSMMVRGVLLCAIGPAALAADLDGDGCPDPSTRTAAGACVDPTASLGANTPGGGSYVGPLVTLTGAVSIAPRATLLGSTDTTLDAVAGPTAIGRRTQLGHDATLGASNTWARAVLAGDRLVAQEDVTVGYGAVLGDDVQLGIGATVGNLAVLGDHVSLGAGARVGRGSRVESGAIGAPTAVEGQVGPDVIVGGGATIGADARVARGATVGAGAQVLGTARVGRGAVIEAGATVESGAVVRAGASVCEGETLVSTQTLARGASWPAGGCPIVGDLRALPIGSGGAATAIEFVGLSEGSFEMGCKVGRDGVDGANCAYTNFGGAVHPVTLTHDFWIGRTEVTQRQFLAIAGVNPAHFTASGLDAPVERVSWHHAAWFANQVSAADGVEACYECVGAYDAGNGLAPTCALRADLGGNPYACGGYRLPTEAEWEYAARGGVTSAYPVNPPDSTTLAQVGWYSANTSPAGTRPVAQLGANGFGLYDMAGNVTEWTQDFWNFSAYPTAAVTDPVGDATGTLKAIRGGDYTREAYWNRSSHRTNAFLDTRSQTMGFRLVRSVP